jgi:regulator of sigma E protease
MTASLLMPLIRLLAFLAAVCLLVTVHEFGHFWVARRLGFKVLRFSVGFGKAIWKRIGKVDGTEYVIAAIPLGGYVKMLDEREGPVPPAELARSFTRRPHWQRIVVLLAGPAFNITFAIVLLTIMLLLSGVSYVRPVLGDIKPASIAGRAGLAAGDEITAIDGMRINAQRDVWLDLLDAVSGRAPITISARTPRGIDRTVTLSIPVSERLHLTEPSDMLSGLGLEFYEPPRPALLGGIEPNGPAARAGLAVGDQIVAVDEVPIHNFNDLQQLIQQHPNAVVDVTYRRGSALVHVAVRTGARVVDGHTVGMLGISSTPSAPLPKDMVRHVSLSLPAAFARANVEAWDLTALQGRLFYRMIVGQVSIKNLSGPLSIAEYAGDSAAAGLSSFTNFLIVISLALGFMNLLPIPILDGGQIVFQAIEWLKGSPLSERFQAVSQQLGVALLVLLMGVALFNDITRQFG